jgi:hypothetical protein
MRRIEMRSVIGKALLIAAVVSAVACSNKSKSSTARSEDNSATVAVQGTTPGVDSVAPPPAAIALSLECAHFNGGAACTATEQRFVNKSVACYNCLVNASCLNDVSFGDKSHECEDLTGQATGGAQRGTASSALCLATIDCILATKCASLDVAFCYCGSLGAGTGCMMSAAPGNGACARAEAAGSNHELTEPASVVSQSLGSIQLPAGKADAIFACAKLNNCEAACSR